jgi:HD superfamily phosphohydrolase
MDPVHGSIQIFDHERRIIDHALFQRLRFINQNDILSLVFPGATHTRFAHSIGAMHVSQRIWDGVLNQNAQYRVAKKSPTRQEEEALIYLNKCVRMAILMHDCGHGAFSHQLENTHTIQKMLSGGRLFKSLWSGVDYTKFYAAEPVEICHEHYSVRAAHKILSEVLLESDDLFLTDVLSIMETTSMNVSDFFKECCVSASVFFIGHREWKNREVNLVEQMLNLLRCFISCEFDADKGDYMLRDSLYSGGNYGNYNLDALTNNFSTAESDGWFGLVLNRKGVGALEAFVLSRFQMYRHIYNHKTSNGFELTLQLAISEVMNNPVVHEFVEKALSDIDQFTDLVDSYFWQEFRSYARVHPKSACAAILFRRPMKFLMALEDVPQAIIEVKREEQAKELGVPLESIVTNTSRIRFSKINDSYSTIMVRDEHPITGDMSLRKISDISPFFGKFSDLDLTQVFYSQWLDSRSGKPA